MLATATFSWPSIVPTLTMGQQVFWKVPGITCETVPKKRQASVPKLQRC